MRFSGAEELTQWLNNAKESLAREGKRPVCVVGLIGQSEGGESKAQLLNDAFQRDIFLGRLSHTESSAKIYAYYESTTQTVLLCLESVRDFHIACPSLAAAEAKESLEWASKEEAVWTRSVLLLAHLCTILVIHSPVARVDLSWLRWLRILNTGREALDIGSALAPLAELISPEWRRDGRPSAPRLLFTFGRSFVKAETGYHKRSELLRKLEESLEAQLFALFRKSRVVLNNSAQAIGALPAKAAFVHVFGPGETPPDKTTQLLKLLQEALPLQTKAPTPLMAGSEADEESAFYRFITDHIDTAFRDGFQDNVGKGVAPAHFELPKLSTWMSVAETLHKFLLVDALPPDLAASLDRKYGVEMEYSQIRCNKSYPVALRAYRDGLPDYYSSHTHELKLDQALCHLRAQARGPCLPTYEQRLREEAKAYWHDGRQGCERESLTGCPCVHPLHAEDGEEGGQLHASSARYLSTCNCGVTQALRDDPFTLKEANVYFYQSINFLCCQRREAYEFPLRSFPRLPSSTRLKKEKEEMKTEGIKTEEMKAEETEETKSEELPVTMQRLTVDESAVAGAVSSGDAASGGGTADTVSGGEEPSHRPPSSEEPTSESKPLVDDVHSLLDPDEDASEDSSQEGEDHGVSDVEDERANRGAGERGEEDADGLQSVLPDETGGVDEKEEDRPKLLRTEEEMLFDDWMPYSGAPVNLLPTFPSWSLLCHGSSALYHHSVGLRDQPNFTHGSNFLLQWDVPLKVDVERWNSAMESLTAASSTFAQQRKAAKPPKRGGEVSVRLYLGLEFECPRGHRFMLASPDRVLKHPKELATGPKDSAAWIIKSDGIPVWFPCSCRNTPPLTAQLSRMHIVTPKAPVTVNLSARVQPDTRQPTVFHTGAPPPAIPLNPAKYYVLRFPYSYVGPKGPVCPPQEPTVAGRFLKGCVSVLPDLPF